MIISFLVDRSWTQGAPNQRGDLVQSAERSGKQLGRAARPVEDLPTIT
jgi:hypothetical protein